MLKSKKLYIALAIIVIITTALIRFYRLNDNFLFDIDSEYQAFLAKTIIKHFHIIWIGVSAGSIGYYLGPGLVYLTAILLWPTRGDPISLAFFSAAVGAVTCLSIYFIGHNLYGKSVAMVSTIIYGFSAFIIRYNQRYWPIFIPLVALWIYYSLVKAEKNPRYLILAVILFSLSFHIHLTLLIFGFFIVWQFVRLFRKIDLFTWAASISGYLFITFPLLIFDFVHKFDNLLMPLRFVTGLFKKRVIAGNFHLNFLLVNLDKIWYVDYMHYSFLGIALTLFLIIILLSIFIISKNSQGRLLFSIILLFSFLFSFYPGTVEDYYVVFLFPFIAIASSILISRMPKVYALSLLSLFILSNVYHVLTYTNNRGLTAKKNLIEKVSRQLKSPFYLSYETELDIEGWRYLFEAYGKKPAQSKSDAMFGWLYPQDIASKSPPLKVNVSNNFKVSILPNN